MTLDELARAPTAGQPARNEVFASLARTYGKSGREGWSLTEILRMDRRRRGRLLDLLGGIARGKPGAPRFPGRFRVRTMDGAPFDIQKVRPDPDVVPEFTDIDGQTHHGPGQWVPQTWTVPAEADLPLADDYDPANSAAWLLLQWGHSAREGGSEKRRWGDKKAKQAGKPREEWLDRWKVAEVAFADRHPTIADLKSVRSSAAASRQTGDRS